MYIVLSTEGGGISYQTKQHTIMFNNPKNQTVELLPLLLLFLFIENNK